jgi:hypothetical protein
MSIKDRSIGEIEAADIAALASHLDAGANTVVVRGLDAAAVAAAISALANTHGGLIVVRGPRAGGDAAVGHEDLTEACLLAACKLVGDAGRPLAQVRLLEEPTGTIGLVKVAEAGSPPVVVETDGGVYQWTPAGVTRILSRAALNPLIAKDRSLRARAEAAVDAMQARVAFGHFNYLTVAVVAAPRISTARPYQWLLDNGEAFEALAFAGRWQLRSARQDVSPGEISLGAGDEGGFLRLARNGCVAVGLHAKRPSQDLYLPGDELTDIVSEMAEASAAILGAGRSGLVLGSLLLDGIRGLRLPVEAGATRPAEKDRHASFVEERFLERAGDRPGFASDLEEALATAFRLHDPALPLTSGNGASPVAVRHGLTKRTERRLAGLRGHGS